MRTVMLAVVALLSTALPAQAEDGSFARSQRRVARVKSAFEGHLAEVEAAFAKAGAAWPPRGLYLRAFKAEGVLELWAAPKGGGADGPRVRVRDFAICAASGGPGPKRREGDGQVPEGFYTIDRYNPRSSYHLSLGIDYPNAVDQARAGDDPPGGDIFIHGECVTIGCLPLENGPIEALYVAAVLARDRGDKHIPVHMFPCRFGDAGCSSAGAPDDEVARLWRQLAEAKAEFDKTRVPPRWVATRAGYEKRE